jgi:hypothetical protein
MSEIPNERVILTRQNADAYLKPGEYVHTFMQASGPGLVLLGADRKRDEILELAELGKVELAGEQAAKMKHGVVAHTEHGPVFCATA